LSFAPSSSAPVYAAIDLGTNNCRMLVAAPSGAGFRVIDCYSRITRLGEGLAAHGVLSDDAMTRTVEALRHCAFRMERSRVTRARLVATEACRRASNHADFARRVSTETGLRLDIIGADEEASLALAGCAQLLTPQPRALVIDIGGGSTELVWVDNRPDGYRRIDGVLSLPLGVVTLAESRGAELADPDGFETVVTEVIRQLVPFEARHQLGAALAQGRLQMLGTSGTVTTLAALHLGLERYDRWQVDGLEMDFTAIATISRRLQAMTHAERGGLTCVGPERADLVVAGCAILAAICRLWPVGRLRVADRGVREGVLQGLIDADTAPVAVERAG